MGQDTAAVQGAPEQMYKNLAYIFPLISKPLLCASALQLCPTSLHTSSNEQHVTFSLLQLPLVLNVLMLPSTQFAVQCKQEQGHMQLEKKVD